MLGGPQGRSGRVENLVPTGIRSRTIQPVAGRYTDWATPAHYLIVVLSQNSPGGTEEYNLKPQSFLSVSLPKF